MAVMAIKAAMAIVSIIPRQEPLPGQPLAMAPSITVRQISLSSELPWVALFISCFLIRLCRPRAAWHIVL